MYILFNPALSETNHVLIDDLPALFNFTATLSVADYHELNRQGGCVQLWSDIPFEGTAAPYSEWTSCDFELDAAAGADNLSSVQDISLSLSDNDDLASPGTVVLRLQLLVPPSDNQQKRFSYTYRILDPSGEIEWLGEFGQNGTLICERMVPETILELAAGWTRKERTYVWTDRAIRTDIPVLWFAKPDEYLVWTVGGEQGEVLAFLVARDGRSVSMPPEYILYASPTSVIHVRPEKVITVTGDALVMSSLPRQRSGLRLLKSMILQHCSPERIAVTLIGEEYLLITTRDTLPAQGIIMTTPDLAHARSTTLSIPTDRLRSLLPSRTLTTSIPTFLLFAPHTFGAHLVTNVNTVTFTSPGPFTLSPAFNITPKTYVSILSPHRSAQIVEPTSGNLPTPPPSPKLTPRLNMPGHHSSSHLCGIALSTEESKTEDSDTQNSSDANDEIVKPLPRLHLRAVTVQMKHLLSMTLFALTLMLKLIFARSSTEDQVEYEGAEPKGYAAEHTEDEHKAPEKLVAIVEEVEDGALDEKDIANDNISMPGPVAAGGLEMEISKRTSRVLSVEVGGSSVVRLAVWEGEPYGVVNAEVNGKRIPFSRMNRSSQVLAGSRVEFWELIVVEGGMLRIFYDCNKTPC